MEKLVGWLIGIVVAVILVLCVLPLRWTMVEPGWVGVVVHKGTFGGVTGVDHEPLNTGIHYYNHWTTDITKYKVVSRSFPSQSMATEDTEKQYNMELKTNDGQNVLVDMTVIYSLNAKEVPILHETVGPNYEDQILLPQVRSEARIAIGQSPAEDLYQGKVREVIQESVKQKLIDSVTKVYPAIQIRSALMRHFRFSDAFENAIEQKKLQDQNVEINKKKALAQEQEALATEAIARGQKLKVIQEAEGRASSARIEADAARYKLEQEAAGNLAKNKADAEGKRLQADALGGGANVVALKFAESLPQHFQVFGIPMGQSNSSIQDLSGMFGNMFPKKVKE